jgi:hypothetical protein
LYHKQINKKVIAAYYFVFFFLFSLYFLFYFIIIMQVNLVAPCPKKHSSINKSNGDHLIPDSIHEDVKDACLELQQILQYSTFTLNENNLIARSRNPLTQDSSFVPLHQVVSKLCISRPKSHCGGERI